MSSGLSRRNVIKGMGATALAPALVRAASAPGMPGEGPSTPKICSPIGGREITDAAIRRVKQIGVDHVLMGGPPIPWKESDLAPMVEKLKAGGLSLGNMMIAGFSKTIYGKPGRDEEIEKVRESIRVAGRIGLPVVEYNFYAHRAMEGYYEETGRAGAGLTAFDYDKMKDLPPLPEEGAHKLEEMWN